MYGRCRRKDALLREILTLHRQNQHMENIVLTILNKKSFTRLRVTGGQRRERAKRWLRVVQKNSEKKQEEKKCAKNRSSDR